MDKTVVKLEANKCASPIAEDVLDIGMDSSDSVDAKEAEPGTSVSTTNSSSKSESNSTVLGKRADVSPLISCPESVHVNEIRDKIDSSCENVVIDVASIISASDEVSVSHIKKEINAEGEDRVLEPSSSRDIPVIKDEPEVKVVKKQSPVPKCDQHPDVECQFWCSSCILAICPECMCGLHREHDFKLLDVVLRGKVRESLQLLRSISANTEKINDRIQDYEDNIVFHKKQIALYEEMTKLCEKRRDLPLLYADYQEGLQNFANGQDADNIDPEVVGNLLKLLHKNEDPLLKRTRVVMASYTGFFGKGNSCGMNLDVDCGSCKLFLQGRRHSPGSYGLKLSCRSFRKLVVSFDLRLLVLFNPYEGKKSYVVSKCFPNLQFNEFLIREHCLTYPFIAEEHVKMHFEFHFHDDTMN